MAEYDLGTARGHIEIDSSGVEYGIGKAKAATSSFDADLQKHGATLAKTGIAMGAVGVAAVAGFGVAINAAANFEQRISAIQAVSGGTADQMDVVRKKALQLGADTKFSAGEAATAMEELAKAGLTLPDILNGAADATTNLAAAGEIDLPQAATIAANAMNQFGLAAKDMPQVADLIAGAANASAIDVSDFGMSMAQAGAVAKLSGLSFRDTAVAIAEFGNAGLKGSDAGTSLKTFLQNLIPTTKQQIELFQQLGIIQTKNGVTAQQYADAMKVQQKASTDLKDAQQKLADIQAKNAAAGDPKTELERVTRAQQLRDATNDVTAAQKSMNAVNAEVKKGIGETSNAFFDAKGNIKDLASLSQVLQNALKGQTKEQQLATLQTMFGSDAIRAAAILSDQGAAGFNNLAASMDKVKAADVAKQRMNNLKGSMEQLRGSVETAMISIGEMGQGPMRSVVDWITKMINGFMKLSPETQQTILVVAGLAAVLVGLVGAFVAAIGVAMKIKKAYDDFKKALAFVKELQLATKAMEGLNASFLTNPIFLVIAAIVAIGIALYELYKHSTGFRNFVDGLWQVVQKAWDAILGVFKSGVAFVKQHMDYFLAALGPIGGMIILWRHFGDTILSVLSDIGGAIMAVIHFVENVFTQLGYMVDLFRHPFDDFSQGFAEIMDNIFGNTGKLIGVFHVVGDTIATVWRFIWESVKNAWTIIKGIWDVIVGVFTGDWGRVWNGVKDIFGGVWDQIHNIFSTVWNLLTGELASFVGNMLVAFAGFVANLVTSAVELAGNLLSAFGSWLTQLPGQIAYFIGFVIGSMIRFQIDMIKAAIDLGVGVVEGIIGFVQSLPGRIWALLVATFNFLMQFQSDAIDWAGRTGSSVIESLISFFAALPGRAWGLLMAVISGMANFQGQAIAWAASAGRGIVDNIIGFVQALPGRVGGFLQDLINKIISYASMAGGYATDIGTNIVNGVINFAKDLPGRISGIISSMIEMIKGAAGRAFDAMKNIGGSLWEGFKSGIGMKSPSYIEKAMTKIVSNMAQGVNDIQGHVNTLNGMAPTMPAAEASLGVARSVGNLASTPTTTVERSTTTSVGGDHIEFHQVKADPIEIAQDIAWQKRLRTRTVAA